MTGVSIDGTSTSACSFVEDKLDSMSQSMGCLKPDGTIVPRTTCSQRIADWSPSNKHPQGYWSPDSKGSVYKGTGSLDLETSWSMGSGWSTDFPYYPDYPVGFASDQPNQRPWTCKDGSTNNGYYRYGNEFGLDTKCPKNLYAAVRTVHAPGSSAADVVFEAMVRHTFKKEYGGQFKVWRLMSRRLGDQRRLSSKEELTQGTWKTDFDATAEAPASTSSTSSSSDSTSSFNGKSGTTTAIAVGASALVVGIAAVALFVRRQQHQHQHQHHHQQDSELQLDMAPADGKAGEL
jgi:hypothetical protein